MADADGWKNRLYFGDNLVILPEKAAGGHRPELPRFAPPATFKKAPQKKKPEHKQGKLW